GLRDLRRAGARRRRRVLCPRRRLPLRGDRHRPPGRRPSSGAAGLASARRGGLRGLGMAVDAQTRFEEREPSQAAGRTDRAIPVLAAKGTAAGLAVAALGFGIWQVRNVVVLLLLALTFAAAIRPGVEWLRGHHVPQPLAIFTFFFAVFAIFAAFCWLA